MMDVSDGLAKDLHALTPRRRRPALAAAAIPVSPAARRVPGAPAARRCTTRSATARITNWSLRSPAAPTARALGRAWRRAFPRLRLTCIGRFVAGGRIPPARSTSRSFTAMNIFAELRAGVVTGPPRRPGCWAHGWPPRFRPTPRSPCTAIWASARRRSCRDSPRALASRARSPARPSTSCIFIARPAPIAGEGRLVHLDAYRLENPHQVSELMLEDFLVSPYCLAVEWPEKIAGWLPADTLHLSLGIEAPGRHRVGLACKGRFAADRSPAGERQALLAAHGENRTAPRPSPAEPQPGVLDGHQAAKERLHRRRIQFHVARVAGRAKSLRFATISGNGSAFQWVLSSTAKPAAFSSPATSAAQSGASSARRHRDTTTASGRPGHSPRPSHPAGGSGRTRARPRPARPVRKVRRPRRPRQGRPVERQRRHRTLDNRRAAARPRQPAGDGREVDSGDPPCRAPGACR